MQKELFCTCCSAAGKYGRRRNLTNAAAEKVVEGKNGENGLGGLSSSCLARPGCSGA